MHKSTKPLKFSRLGLRLLVYPNRLEIHDGLWPAVKRSTLLYSNIASVGIGQYTQRLEITTNDGKTLKYAIGGFGNVQRCYDALMERM